LAGKPAEIPRNYFPADDPARPPLASWRPYGRLLFANWLAAIALDQDVHPEPSLLAMPG
jgi:homoserine O-succinyltransferase